MWEAQAWSALIVVSRLTPIWNFVRHVADRSMLTIVPSVVRGWYQVRSFALSVVMVSVASYVQSVAH